MHWMTQSLPRFPAVWQPAPERIAPSQQEVVLVAAPLDVDPQRL
jgi:hypothetical protein